MNVAVIRLTRKNKMHKMALLLFAVMLSGCNEGAVNTQIFSSPTPPLCRVRFGASSKHTILIGWTKDSLLVYRDGNIESNPKKYPMPKRRLDSETNIPPFTFDGVSYSIIRCKELNDVGTIPRKLLIYMRIDDGQCSFTQLCEVTLKTDSNLLETVCFDGELSVQLCVPDKLNFDIGGQPTDVRVFLGTINKSAWSWTTVSVQDGDKCTFNDAVRPELIVDFPTVDGNGITKKYILDDFC